MTSGLSPLHYRGKVLVFTRNILPITDCSTPPTKISKYLGVISNTIKYMYMGNFLSEYIGAISGQFILFNSNVQYLHTSLLNIVINIMSMYIKYECNDYNASVDGRIIFVYMYSTTLLIKTVFMMRVDYHVHISSLIGLLFVQIVDLLG